MASLGKSSITFHISDQLVEKNLRKIDQDIVKKSWFILPCNDGEAKRACQILSALKAPYVHISKQKWGAILDKELDFLDWSIAKKVKRVFVFEIPGKNSAGMNCEDIFSKKGLELIIIDHHYYQWVNRYHEDSSLEQLCSWLKWPLNRADEAISVNDRSYIPGLCRLGLQHADIVKVRNFDLNAQGFAASYISSQRSKLPRILNKLEEKKQGDLWILKNPEIEKVFILEELAVTADAGIVHMLEVAERKLSFSGSPKAVDYLLSLDYCEYGFKPGYVCYGGGDGSLAKFWGFRPKSSRELVKPKFVNTIIGFITKFL